MPTNRAPELLTPSKSLAILPPNPLMPLPVPALPDIAAKIPKPVADCVSGGIRRVTAWYLLGMSIAISALARNAENTARNKNLRLCQRSCRYGSNLIGSSRASIKRDVPGAPFLTVSGSISGAGTLPAGLNSDFLQLQYSMLPYG